MVAEAALRDTLDVTVRTAATRTVLVIDGPPLAGLPARVTAQPQRGGGLGARLAAAFADVGGPVLLIGMDTPQVDPDLLDLALGAVDRGETVWGPATDGGWWALGLPRPCPGAFAGVPMSTPTTGARQRDRLRRLGLDPRPLPALRDVDRWPDALAVAASVPGSRFAAAVAAVAPGVPA
jgi:glycosyltransferase A (GT-A) superfamily protein (DUF2064 family)